MGLEHIVLHVALCNAVARLSPNANVAMSVKVTDKVNNAQVDKVVQFARGTGNEARAEFDSTWGTYRIVITVPKYRCSDVDYVHILQDHNRNLYTKLIDGPSSLVAPVLILGALPQSFAYVEPT
ncbi:MAG TPA: hypothetical protein VGR69_05135, partial [Candidatus Rubrimentiphilum sp.]|nr:hypothetical protein [Candidatus Rubrimentiphilum sp.]